MNGELTNAIDKIVEKFGIAIDWTDKNALPLYSGTYAEIPQYGDFPRRDNYYILCFNRNFRDIPD